MDYKEKLRLAKEALESGSYDKETIEYIFPELKESEDERIRKELLNYLYDVHDDDEERARWIAWLEKQAEQKPAEWSKEDDQYLLICKNALAKYQVSDKWDACIISHWLENKIKSLRYQNTWKPSDEQMKVLLSEVEGWKKGCPKQIVLESLYNDLQKLKG